MDMTTEMLDSIVKERAKRDLTEFKLNTLIDVILDNTYITYDDELKIENEGKDKIITAVKYLCSDEYNERRGALIFDRTQK